MSEEQLRAILATLAGDANFRAKLSNAKDADAVAAMAKEAGFTIAFDAFALDREPLEVSDQHLESLVGSGQAAVVKCTRPACLTATSKNHVSNLAATSLKNMSTFNLI
jgi:predicted ribosomally synthesized peptide with nif11-like leader